MASNFRISIHRNNRELHLKLRGDFDGSSGFELINTLKDHDGTAGKVVIHTGGLANIYSFGVGVFQRNCTFSRKSPRSLCFTGKYAKTLAPSGSNFAE
jgi:anti-anti-sigma regulatory factor